MSPAIRCLGLVLALGACATVQEPAGTAEEGDPMVLISLFSTEEVPPKAEGNFRAEPGVGTVASPPIPFDRWTEEEQQAFPKLANGDLDPAWIMLHIEEGNSTCWPMPTGWGKKYTFCKG